jgi:lipopolysaccharide exporter
MTDDSNNRPPPPEELPPRTPRKGTGSFASNFLSLTGGAVVAQALSFLFVPVMSRLFPPEAYGIATVFNTVVPLICIISCLRYQLAIVLPERDEDAAPIFSLCVLLSIAMAALVCAVIWGLGPSRFSWLAGADLAAHRWLLPLGVFLGGIVLPLWNWDTRHKHFRMLASRQILATLVFIGAALTAGLLGYRTGTSLILAGILGSVVSVVTLALPLLGFDGKFLLAHSSLASMVRMGRRYVRFPLVDSWAALLQGLSANISILMMTAVLGASVVGLYSKSGQLLLVPLALIGNSISQVLFQRAAEKRAANQDLSGLVQGVVSRLIAVSMLPTVVIALIGAEVFSVVCGRNWGEAGVYAAILSPWLLIVGLTNPLLGLFNVTERLGASLLYNLVVLIVRIAAIAFGGWVIKDARWTLAIYAVVGMIADGWLLWFLLSLAGASLRPTARVAGLHLLFALPTAAAAAAAKWLLGLPPALTVAVAAVVSASYWYPAFRRDPMFQGYLAKARGKLRAALGLARK